MQSGEEKNLCTYFQGTRTNSQMCEESGSLCHLIRIADLIAKQICPNASVDSNLFVLYVNVKKIGFVGLHFFF